MFWTMEDLRNFAVSNNLTLDDTFKAVQLVYMISGVVIHKLFADLLKSAAVKKFLQKWKKRFDKNDGKEKSGVDV